jgi:protein-histidine N-methyltransferase
VLINVAKEEKELFTNYAQWIKGFGAEFSKMKIRYIAEEYRGVTAGADIEKGETIISVPKHAIITLQMAKETEVGKKIIEQKVSLIYPNNSTLATFVLLEKSKATTKWKPLFDAFPKKVDNFPIFYNKEELDLLKGTQFTRI